MDGCEEHRDKLILYIYGELEGAEKADFEVHLENCEGCARELAGLAPVHEALTAAAPSDTASGELAAEIRRHARQPRAVPLHQARKHRDRRRSYLGTAAAACIAALLVAGGYFYIAGGPGRRGEVARTGQVPRADARTASWDAGFEAELDMINSRIERIDPSWRRPAAGKPLRDPIDRKISNIRESLDSVRTGPAMASARRRDPLVQELRTLNKDISSLESRVSTW